MYNLSVSGTSSATLLLSPTLHLLDLWFGDEDNEEHRVRSPHVITSLLQILPVMVPDLQHLIYDVEFDLGQEYLQSFTQFTQLKILTTPPSVALNEYMLKVLSSLPTLQNLSCFIDLSGISALALCSNPFPELAELDLAGQSDHLFTFIFACPVPKLERIKLRIDQPPSARHPRDMFAALCRSCDATQLTSFFAEFTHPFAARPNSLMVYFEPLLALRNMLSFHLGFTSTEPSIRNDDLARIGNAWPRLASLRIKHSTTRYSQRDIAAPSLFAVVELARRCPCLRSLHLPELDPHVPPDSSEGSADTPPALGHPLHVLVIANIRPPLSFRVHMGVATVLDRVFPSIDLNASQFGLHGRGWQDVLGLMEAMRVGRANGAVYTDLQRQG